MENGSGNVTMNAGIPVSVNNAGVKEISGSVLKTNSEEVSKPEGKAPDSNKKSGEDTGIGENIKAAESLLETAKKDGVNAAFEELAHGETEAVQNDPGADDVSKEESDESSGTQAESEETSDEEKDNDDNGPEEEEKQSEVTQNEAKVVDLVQLMHEQIEKRKNFERQVLLNGQGIEYNPYLYELEYIIRKLMKEAEEDPEAKQGLLMVLVRLMIEFVTGTVKEGVKEVGNDVKSAA